MGIPAPLGFSILNPCCRVQRSFRNRKAADSGKNSNKKQGAQRRGGDYDRLLSRLTVLIKEVGLSVGLPALWVLGTAGVCRETTTALQSVTKAPGRDAWFQVIVSQPTLPDGKPLPAARVTLQTETRSILCTKF